MFELELEHVKKLAKKTGLFLGKTTVKEIDSEEGRDIKLALDKEAERMIISSLNSAFDYPFLSEEAGEVGVIVSGQPYWIIDPIDGTMNYSKNFPMACVSIALWQDDSPILGVIYDFNRNEMFSGLVGAGAWLNNTPLARHKFLEPNKAVLATGFPTYLDLDESVYNEYFELCSRFKKIRMIGSAALSLCYVASSRVDAYYEQNIKLWDVAAGLAIIKALDLKYKIILKEDFLTITSVGIY